MATTTTTQDITEPDVADGGPTTSVTSTLTQRLTPEDAEDPPLLQDVPTPRPSPKVPEDPVLRPIRRDMKELTPNTTLTTLTDTATNKEPEKAPRSESQMITSVTLRVKEEAGPAVTPTARAVRLKDSEPTAVIPTSATMPRDKAETLLMLLEETDMETGTT